MIQNRTTQIKSVSCDMNAVYPSVLRKYFLNATIVYDIFHVMKNFTLDVLRAGKANSLQVCKDRISKWQKELKAKKKVFEAIDPNLNTWICKGNWLA